MEQSTPAPTPVPYPWRRSLLCILPTILFSLGLLAWFGGDQAAVEFLALHRNANPRLDAAMTWFSFYGNAPFYAYYAIMFFVELKRRHSGGYQLILACTGGFVATTLVASLLKFSIGRPRPGTEDGYVPFTLKSRYLSFPSGHVAETTVCAQQISNYYNWTLLSVALGIPAALMAASRLDSKGHYPTDLIGGALVGLLGAFVAWKIASMKIPGLTRAPKFMPR